MVKQFNRPTPLVMPASLWLAAETDDVTDKHRCLDRVLELDPQNDTPQLALQVPQSGKPDD